MKDFPVGLCWGTIHRASLAETIELAGRHGFPTIAVSPHIHADSIADGLSEQALRRHLQDAGVSVRVIDCIAAGLPGMPPGDTKFGGRTIAQADAETCFRVAEALEAPVVNISLYNSEVVPVAEMAEAVGAICRQAATRGMAIAIEFYPESGIRDLAQAHAIARTCGEANCGVMLDTWHLARSGGTVADIAALPPDAITAFQLSDRTEPPPGTPYVPMTGRRLPGEGELPLDEIVSAALANSPGITMELEVFSEELRAMPLEDSVARIASAVRSWKEKLAA
ncbi:MAG: sugar phosphate isomerase/epimerase [Novosphingobium sp.]|nr:sugar phosphate isomerase/epimerase [Novosphingobium sp.]MCP5403929.1 sugar phosphate isomerase/epimerase [Novosphingobium sp.]